MRSKLFVFTAILFGMTTLGMAQTDSAAGWHISMVTDLTVTQTSYSDSWAGGEAGSASWVWNLDGAAEKALSESINFRSNLRLKFGQTLTQTIRENPVTGATEKNWEKPKKSTDLIDWENVARFTLHKYVDPYAAFRVESQFYDGSHPDKKLYLNPLKLTESAGLARQFYKKDDKEFVTSRLGLALRQTMVKSIVDADLNTESETITDGGLESVSDASLKLSERMHWVGKLSLYKALFSSESDNEAIIGTEREDYWKAIDANLENTITASVSKVISVSLYTQVLYDKEVEKKARFKETLGLGFSYRMF
jgi:hypothetical protein